MSSAEQQLNHYNRGVFLVEEHLKNTRNLSYWNRNILRHSQKNPCNYLLFREILWAEGTSLHKKAGLFIIHIHIGFIVWCWHISMQQILVSGTCWTNTVCFCLWSYRNFWLYCDTREKSLSVLTTSSAWEWWKHNWGSSGGTCSWWEKTGNAPWCITKLKCLSIDCSCILIRTVIYENASETVASSKIEAVVPK